MLVEGIKSRPRYTGLVADPKARRNVVAAEGEGALAAIEMIGGAGPAFAERTTVFYTAAGSAPAAHAERFAALGVDALHLAPTIPTLLTRLDGLLTTATMGTRLYATGTEGFIGQVIRLADGHGIDHGMVVTEHRGSLARRVQCVHCKGITEDVTTSIVVCAHCGLNLLVRDHYSRRIAAFQGVCIDAEVPGEVPPAEEVFR